MTLTDEQMKRITDLMNKLPEVERETGCGLSMATTTYILAAVLTIRATTDDDTQAIQVIQALVELAWTMSSTALTLYDATAKGTVH